MQYVYSFLVGIVYFLDFKFEGHSAYHIGQVLTNKKIKSPMGKDKWQTSSVLNILQNEKYKGDAILQKCFTTDFLLKKRKVNEWELPQYYVTDDHEAIIDRGTFDLVQTELVKRRGVQGRTVFSGKIKCAECGCYYGAKVWHSIDKENLSA